MLVQISTQVPFVFSIQGNIRNISNLMVIRASFK